MPTAASITTVAHVIQLSVGPVFLLTGIGAMLSVLTSRLARIVDRFRTLNNTKDEERIVHEQEMTMLLSRARWIHWAISLCTLSALLICIVIAALFVGSVMSLDPSSTISVLFILAMLALISGLLCFLREIFLATGLIEKYGK
ncbi:hypothetical protein SFMTTN_3070 [Sulfuriferula multivorans]|uniref:DUF2721 domain-containing protein n=1 Tax=Sulfuriferula multivorans TaxID=1559896 RepID=A0A401K018_9PROT|nr:DUF2721 domain-containing protein [Sulfuriferula multivorans]GCB02248.1 hypothetical protein SFMTTN_3070 [Sulfuriferula multivorans]